LEQIQDHRSAIKRHHAGRSRVLSEAELVEVWKASLDDCGARALMFMVGLVSR
jgi:hypothetical protein